MQGTSNNIQYSNLQEALAKPNTQLRLYGKPEVSGQRRMGVTVARGETIEQARQKAREVIEAIEVELNPFLILYFAF